MTFPFLSFANTVTEDLAFQEGGVDWTADWWKVIIIAFSALLFLFLCLRLALYILRIVGVILCVAAGVAGGWLAYALLGSRLAELVGENLQPYAPFAAAFAGFLVTFAIAAGVMSWIRKPAQPAKAADPEKEKS